MTQVADIFSNRYEIERGIARGGMAQVYKAHDQLLDRPVAVKVLFPEFARDPSFVERFRREAQAAANLNHPNIVAVYDWGQEQGTYFIVMEYVDGSPLRDLIRTEGRIAPSRAAQIGGEIAGALAFAHRGGVVHRDVKPGNVLITDSGAVKVTDFGIARATQGGTGEALTQTGSVMGTATYFSPEQAQGLPVDGRSDVYSLGVVLYEMVTGETPFTAETPVAMAYKHVREEPLPPSQRNPDLPPDLETIVLTAMAKDLDARYQSADDLREDLERFGRGLPPAGVPLTAVVAEESTGAGAASTVAMASVGTATVTRERVEEPPPRRRTGAIVAIVVVLALLVAAIAALALAGGDENGGGADTIAVPNVVDTQFADAERVLEDLGFEVEREDVESPEPPDLVLGQDPPEGRKLEEGARVILEVSSPTFTMPNVIGQQRAEAEQEIKDLGYQDTVQVDEQDSTEEPGTVLSTSPIARADVRKAGEEVRLVVAREAPVAVPAVFNLLQSDADNRLRLAGFEVTVQQESSNEVSEGRATRTDPPEGTLLRKGDPVVLFVSTGPDLVDVPSTLGQLEEDAVDTLEAAGFTVTVANTPSSPANNGRVVAQDPAGGRAAPGSNVTITVGTGPGPPGE